MKKIFPLSYFLICGFALITLNAYSQVPNWQWAKTAIGSSSLAHSICTDASGNSYVAGQFGYPSITFGSITLTSNGPYNNNLFLVKYDQSGNVLWAKNAGGKSDNIATSVAVDNSGNVFIAGVFSDTIIFGSTTLINSGYSHMFLAKYDPLGNAIWAQKMGGSLAGDCAYSVATDVSGNCYVTGGIQGSPTATFGPYTLIHNDAASDIFIVKYDPNGNVLWAKDYGGNSQDIAYSVTTDPSGNSYITGRFLSTTITFGFTTLAYCGTFLVKSDAAGNVIWAKSSSGTTVGGAATGNSVSTDALGNSYITGYFYDSTVTFGSTTLNNAYTGNGYSEDMFFVKYGPSGNVLWAKSVGGISSFDVGTSVFADSLGNSYFTGYFASSTITFGSITLTLNGFQDIFIAKYDPSGNVLWAKNAGGTSAQESNSIAVDASGNCHIAGAFFSPTLVFGSTTLTNSSGSGGEMFIAKTGNVEGINSFTASGNSISIFPNPSNGKFTLEASHFENWEMGSLEIYSVLGEKMVSEKIISEKTEIDLSGNAKGIYFYRIFNSTEIIGSGKMIVE